METVEGQPIKDRFDVMIDVNTPGPGHLRVDVMELIWGDPVEMLEGTRHAKHGRHLGSLYFVDRSVSALKPLPGGAPYWVQVGLNLDEDDDEVRHLPEPLRKYAQRGLEYGLDNQ